MPEGLKIQCFNIRKPFFIVSDPNGNISDYFLN